MPRSASTLGCRIANVCSRLAQSSGNETVTRVSSLLGDAFVVVGSAGLMSVSILISELRACATNTESEAAMVGFGGSGANVFSVSGRSLRIGTLFARSSLVSAVVLVTGNGGLPLRRGAGGGAASLTTHDAI